MVIFVSLREGSDGGMYETGGTRWWTKSTGRAGKVEPFVVMSWWNGSRCWEEGSGEGSLGKEWED